MTMNQSTPLAPAPNQANAAQLNRALALAALQRQMRSGATNFYFIAVLSVVNTLIYIFGGGLTFVVGLAFTELIDGFAAGFGKELPQYAALATGMDILLSLCVAGIIALFGYFGGKGERWAFLVGMVFYGLDALIGLAFGDWLMLAFHLFFLWRVFAGFQALNQLQRFAPKPANDFPQNIGVS